jgi:hypothetical protein
MSPSTVRETPTPMLVATALLAVYSAAAAWVAWQDGSWFFALAALLALAACIGTATLRGWSQYLVYGLTLAFIGGWGWSVWRSVHAGYFELLGTREMLVSQAPSAALVCLSGLCTWLVLRHFRGAWPRP